jgi:hypothetical protein
MKCYSIFGLIMKGCVGCENPEQSVREAKMIKFAADVLNIDVVVALNSCISFWKTCIELE